MSSMFKHISYKEYEKLDYTQKPCSGMCCFNKRVCSFCLDRSEKKLMLDKHVYWVMRSFPGDKKNNLYDFFALSFCNETCFNCWVLLNEI